MASIPTKKPTTRVIQIRGLVFALAGKEQPYDVYRFSEGSRKLERPGHNPFKNL